jgi:hypothetical protein
MSNLLDYPRVVCVLSFIVLWGSALLGAFVRKKLGPLDEAERDVFGFVQTAILTLLGLIIGFTFSMALGRYDQRKNYEEAEANAIGTEYVRADLLPAAEATTARELLKSYLEQRVLFYTTRDSAQLQLIDIRTTKLQNDLWSVVHAGAASQPTPVIALAVSGMNDVLNSQGYTQAAWWYRIPPQAWTLMMAIAIWCNLLLGYGARRPGRLLFLVVPLAVAISFYLIADIDSPRRGWVSVSPLNLTSLSQTLHAQ